MTRVILFDAAGTLIRVRGSVGAAYSSIAAAHGVEVPPADLETAFGDAFGKMPPLCFPGRSAAELPALERGWWKTLVREVFRQQEFPDFDAYFDELFAYFAEPLSWELFFDVRSTLDQLRDRGLRLGIVSNFDGRLTRICEGLGLLPYFEVVVMSARAGFAKPDPRIFLATLEALGEAPADALHIGDSEKEDVRGARDAGLQALLIDRSGGAPQPHGIRDLRRIVDHL